MLPPAVALLLSFPLYRFVTSCRTLTRLVRPCHGVDLLARNHWRIPVHPDTTVRLANGSGTTFTISDYFVLWDSPGVPSTSFPHRTPLGNITLTCAGEILILNKFHPADTCQSWSHSHLWLAYIGQQTSVKPHFPKLLFSRC